MLCSTENNKPRDDLGKNAYKQLFMSPQIDSKNRNFYNDPTLNLESRPLDGYVNHKLGSVHSKSVGGD